MILVLLSVVYEYAAMKRKIPGTVWRVQERFFVTLKHARLNGSQFYSLHNVTLYMQRGMDPFAEKLPVPEETRSFSLSYFFYADVSVAMLPG